MNLTGMKKAVALLVMQLTVAGSAFAVANNAYAGQPVNINKADAKTIADSLDNIGDSKARAIVEYRTKHGAFTSVEQLGNVKGIGEKTLAKNKSYILFRDKPVAQSSQPAPKK